jgi:hypothetical protein
MHRLVTIYKQIVVRFSVENVKFIGLVNDQKCV